MRRITIFTLAFIALLGPGAQVLADDDSAQEQLEDAAQSSEDAANAPTPEQAREEAGGQFDTDADSDAVDLRDCEPNCEVDPCELAPEKCKDQGGPVEESGGE
jgi:hypothetical protein